MSDFPSTKMTPAPEDLDPPWKCALIGGVGGALPTLSRFGASLVADPGATLPAPGFYLGIAIFVGIGATLCYALKERSLRGALFAGIAAPAIIASGVAGLSDLRPGGEKLPHSAPSASSASSTSWLDILVPPALAQTVSKAEEADCSALRERSSGSGVHQGAPIYNYRVAIRLSGSTGWQFGTANTWNLDIRCARGTFVHAIPADLSTFTFQTLSPVVELRLDHREGIPSQIQLPANTGGIIQLNVVVETKKDLLWALGGRGLPRLRSLSTSFVPGRTTGAG